MTSHPGEKAGIDRNMPRAQDNSVLVSIANDRADAAAVVEALDRFGAEHGVPFEVLAALQVSVDEIVSNVVQYAWKDGETHQVHVRITAQADAAVEVEVVDDGEAFDPFSAPGPPASGRGSGGLGIHMVRQLMDAVGYVRKGGRNHTVMVKRCRLGGLRREGHEHGERSDDR